MILLQPTGVPAFPGTEEIMKAHGAPLALLVGGDTSTRAMVRGLLGEAGCIVNEITTPHTLRAAMHAAAPSLLVVVANGFDAPLVRTLTKLRLGGHRAPIVLMIHGSGEQLRQRALALGAADVVSLPADPHEVLVRLKVAMEA